MNITEAYNILHKIYNNSDLQLLYREKGFDNSESDTIRKHLFHAKLLKDKAVMPLYMAEQEQLLQAAKVFEELYEEENYKR